MVVELIFNSNKTKYSTLNTIGMRTAEVYSSTKKPERRGKWYFEVEHISGEGPYYLIGFYNNRWMAQAQLSPDYKNIIWINDLVKDTAKRIETNCKTSTNPTIGVGIDLDEQMFYVFYSNNYYTTKDFTIKKNEKVNIVIREDKTATFDTVKVNFGYEPFKYNISAFRPWAFQLPQITCIYKKGNRYCSILLMNTLFIK